MPMLVTLASESVSMDVIWITRDVILDYAPQPLIEDDPNLQLAPELYALGVRVLDFAMAQLLRPDLAPSATQGARAKAAGPARGTRAAAEDPHLYDVSFRLAAGLLTSFPERFFKPGPSDLAPVGGVTSPLLCGSPVHALVASALACLSFFDRSLAAGVCTFLRALVNVALELPQMPRKAAGIARGDDEDIDCNGAAGGDIDADPRALERARRAQREEARESERQSAASREAHETVMARNVRMGRHSRVLSALSLRVNIPDSALAATGPNALVLPGSPSELAMQRLYKRLLVVTLKEFPLDALEPRDHAQTPPGVLKLLERLLPEGGMPRQWFSEVLSDPAVIRPGVVEPPRLMELAQAALDSHLSGSSHAQAFLDLAEAVRGRDSGRPPVTPGGHRGGAAASPARRMGPGAAVEDDDDELD